MNNPRGFARERKGEGGRIREKAKEDASPEISLSSIRLHSSFGIGYWNLGFGILSLESN
jgi:hypothetical protein